MYIPSYPVLFPFLNVTEGNVFHGCLQIHFIVWRHVDTCFHSNKFQRGKSIVLHFWEALGHCIVQTLQYGTQLSWSTLKCTWTCMYAHDDYVILYMYDQCMATWKIDCTSNLIHSHTSSGSSLKSLISNPLREESILRNSKASVSESAREISADPVLSDWAGKSPLDTLSASFRGWANGRNTSR